MHFNGSANTTSGIRISSGSVLSAGEAPRRNPTYDPIGGLPKSRGRASDTQRETSDRHFGEIDTRVRHGPDFEFRLSTKERGRCAGVGER